MVKRVFLILVVVVTVLFSANGFSAPAEVGMGDLYHAAKAEGKVVWQFIGPVNLVKSVAEAFQTKYPDIKISVFSYGATGIATRIITEASAEKLSMDVAMSFPNYFIPLLERNLLTKHDWTQIGVSKNNVLFDATSVAVQDVPYVWLYNTNLVSKGEVPKTWEDLLDLKWRGSKIAVRAAPSAFPSLFPAWKRDRQKVASYLDKLRRQEVVSSTRAAEVAARVASGECLVGGVPVEVAIDTIKKNAPVGVCPIGPAAAAPAVVGIPQKVLNPNAAKLFIAWLSGPEGRDAYRKAGLGFAAPCHASPVAQLLCEHGISFTPITSVEDVKEYAGDFGKMVVEKMGFLPE